MQTPDLAVGDVVEVRFTKWGDHQHWELDARYLGEDEHGWWVGRTRRYADGAPRVVHDNSGGDGDAGPARRGIRRDVIRLRDGRVVVDDEDEFLEHQVSLGYPDQVVTLAQASCDAVVTAVSTDEEPWRSVGHRWAEVGAQTTLAAGPTAEGR